MAKIRALSPATRVLLRTELGAGHGGPSGRYDAWKEEALVLAFLLDALGLRQDRAELEARRSFASWWSSNPWRRWRCSCPRPPASRTST